MQFSRAFFLSPEKTFKRKMIEMLIAVELEQKFSKQQIFEFYANRVDLGQRGSFTISGFAEGAHSYFNKDLKDITLPEAALLAGLIQAPSYLSPYRHPERAMERRNTVLEAMVETGDITRAQADKAKAMPLKLAPPNVEASDAPYFVDMVRDTVVSKLNEHEVNEQRYRIYTTLDPELQRAAAQAVETGIKLVDEQVTKMRTKKKKIGKNKFETTVLPGPQAQVALVAMDPHTGEIKALVGGRNYGTSQLNHALAKRPTGSIFKPFVYAAAMNTALDGSTTVITPASIVTDQPSTFSYGDQIYEPRNYKEEYHGDVTLRYALALSLNNATVKVAEEVGYDKVADLAKAAGIASVKATPAMALGAYDATPVDMTSAYTTFANGGMRLSPVFVNSVRNAKGDIVVNFDTEQQRGSGSAHGVRHDQHAGRGHQFRTAYGVRRAALPLRRRARREVRTMDGSPDTRATCSASFGLDTTTTATCGLSGAQTAAPIWAEFMKKAVDASANIPSQAFQPAGRRGRRATGQDHQPPGNARCPDDYTIAFVAGTEPHDTCDQTGGGVQGFFSRMFGGNSEKSAASSTTNGPTTNGNPEARPVSNQKRRAKKRRASSARSPTYSRGIAGDQKE